MYFSRESVIDLMKSGLSVREISKKTGTSKTTVGRWLQEADKVIVSHCLFVVKRSLILEVIDQRSFALINAVSNG